MSGENAVSGMMAVYGSCLQGAEECRSPVSVCAQLVKSKQLSPGLIPLQVAAWPDFSHKEMC